MGIALYSYFVIDAALKNINMPLDQIKMCELGNQKMRRHSFPRSYRQRHFVTSKGFFFDMGIGEHVSFDTNGECGSEKVDLSELQYIEKYNEHFDIVTNYEVAEHINDNSLMGQYNFFANIHRFLRVGGIVAHLIPIIVEKRHCKYVYHEDFIKKLSEDNKYEIIIDKFINKDDKNGFAEKFEGIAVRKQIANDFYPYESFCSNLIVENEGNRHVNN